MDLDGAYKNNLMELWFSGYLLDDRSINDILLEAVEFYNNDVINIETLSKWVCEFSGHFSFVLKIKNGPCFASVDKISSIPIYTAYDNGKFSVSNHAPLLKDIFKTSKFSIEAISEVIMSGFVMGEGTIYDNIKRLSAGECVLWKCGNMYKNYYYTYIPTKVSFNSEEQLKVKLKSVILSVLKKTIKSVNGRQIVIPLSAGNDSRLIASGLKELNYKNIICFTYGRRGNYEVETSKKIAKLLGYKWIYIQDTIDKKRAFFKSSVYKDYVEKFESYASVPNIQDIYEVYTLKMQKIIDNDAVIVNGNTGDFISGGHVFNDLINFKKVTANELNWSLFLDKHYSLWGRMRTRDNDKKITSKLLDLTLERCKFKGQNKFYQYAVMECMECIGRQSRLVANQQRAYEFIDHEWRLPLWNEDFLYFWKDVPVELKVNQKLYKEVLEGANWGGVWKEIKVNNKLVRPYSLLIIRLVVKILSAPMGKKFWHSLEKNMFDYWMHPTYARSISPYFKVLFDMRKQRNTDSWTADQFITKYGFRFDRVVSSIKDGKSSN